MDSYPYSTKCI